MNLVSILDKTGPTLWTQTTVNHEKQTFTIHHAKPFGYHLACAEATLRWAPAGYTIIDENSPNHKSQ